MKVQILFEDMDCVPPKVLDGLRRSVVEAMKAWGIPPNIDTNRVKEQEAYQRWWKWVAEHGQGPSQD